MHLQRLCVEGTSELLRHKELLQNLHTHISTQNKQTQLVDYTCILADAEFLCLNWDFLLTLLTCWIFMNKSHKLGIYLDKLSSAPHRWTVYILSSVLTQPADRAQCSAVQPSRPGRAGTWERNIPCLLKLFYFLRGLFKIICIQLQQALLMFLLAAQLWLVPKSSEWMSFLTSYIH